MRRRHLVALLGAGIGPSLGGCLDDRSGSAPATNSSATESDGTPTVDRSEPPSYDCDAATRPEPLDSDDTTAVRPATYPSHPESPTDAAATDSYVLAFERAYRQNSLVRQERDELVQFSFSHRETRTYDVPVDAAVVRVQYQYSWTVEEDGRTSIADSPNIFATYYVDRSVVLRAVDSGIRDDPGAIDPDPWQTGSPVECFE